MTKRVANVLRAVQGFQQGADASSAAPAHIPLCYLAPPISRRLVPEDALEDQRSITQSYLRKLVVGQ